MAENDQGLIFMSESEKKNKRKADKINLSVSAYARRVLLERRRECCR